MDKDATLTFRLPATLRRTLERAAEADRRSLGSFTTLLIEEALLARGIRPDGARTTARKPSRKG